MQNNSSFIGPQEIIRKKNEFMIPCVYHFYQEPVQMVRGEGQYLFGHSGKKYLDFYAGVSVLNAGHCHPEIVDKICEQVKTLQHTTTIYLTQPIVDLAERLAHVTPQNLRKSTIVTDKFELSGSFFLITRGSTKQK